MMTVCCDLLKVLKLDQELQTLLARCLWSTLRLLFNVFSRAGEDSGPSPSFESKGSKCVIEGNVFSLADHQESCCKHCPQGIFFYVNLSGGCLISLSHHCLSLANSLLCISGKELSVLGPFGLFL